MEVCIDYDETVKSFYSYNIHCVVESVSNREEEFHLNMDTREILKYTIIPEILAVIKFHDLPEIWQKCIIGGI